MKETGDIHDRGTCTFRFFLQYSLNKFQRVLPEVRGHCAYQDL
jgi:hypothetical protein